jgi:hypothetical protein
VVCTRRQLAEGAGEEADPAKLVLHLQHSNTLQYKISVIWFCQYTLMRAYSIHHVQLRLRVQGHSGFKASSVFFSLALFCDHPVWCMPSKMVNGLRVSSPTQKYTTLHYITLRYKSMAAPWKRERLQKEWEPQSGAREACRGVDTHKI